MAVRLAAWTENPASLTILCDSDLLPEHLIQLLYRDPGLKFKSSRAGSAARLHPTREGAAAAEGRQGQSRGLQLRMGSPAPVTLPGKDRGRGRQGRSGSRTAEQTAL